MDDVTPLFHARPKIGQSDERALKYSATNIAAPDRLFGGEERILETKFRRTVGAVCLGLAVACLVLAGVVRAADVYGAFTFGTTTITSSSCAADAYGVLSSQQLNINNGDNVLIDYNVSWSDTRTSPATSASHYFNMTVSYPLRTDQWASHAAVTTGSSSGSQGLQISVTNVAEGNSITIALLAMVTSAGCSPNPTSDTASGTILLI